MLAYWGHLLTGADQYAVQTTHSFFIRHWSPISSSDRCFGIIF